MAKDHYLPASWIGQFSEPADQPLAHRDRKVFLARRGSLRVLPQAARAVGFRKNLYAIKTPLVPTLTTADQRWAMYEPRIPAAIAELAASDTQSLTLETWFRTLVPMVAGAFVRTLDYGDIAPANVARVWPEGLPDGVVVDSNMDRLIDHQILMGLLLYCRWGLIRSSAGELVLPDTGVAPAVMRKGQVGMVFPLTPRLAVTITRGPGNLRAIWADGRWVMAGFTAQTDPDVLESVIRSAITCARSAVFTADERSAAAAAELLQEPRSTFLASPRWLDPIPTFRQEFGDKYFEASDAVDRVPSSPDEYLYFSGDRFWTKGARGRRKPDPRR